ncbi:MAG: isochorismatase family protein [Cyanobacteria bacterium SZAS TMP-1]|nr:isochorismatase family protein [Cyanobacteria bacterium SZAS TMP-1]
MPVTAIDPVTALIVIDLQKGIMAMGGHQGFAPVVEKTRLLLQIFRSRHLPVILVNVDGKPSGRTEQSRNLKDLPADWTELILELNQHPSDHLVTKRTAGAFTNTDLERYLKEVEVTQVVIVGVATSMGVESTGRQAYELGFNVTMATDAMADLLPECHTNSITRIFPRIAETGTTAEIIALVESSIKPHAGATHANS